MSSAERSSENLERINRPAPSVRSRGAPSPWERQVLRWNNPFEFSDTSEDSYSSSSDEASYLSTSSEESEEEIQESSGDPESQLIVNSFELSTSEGDSLSISSSDEKSTDTEPTTRNSK